MSYGRMRNRGRVARFAIAGALVLPSCRDRGSIDAKPTESIARGETPPREGEAEALDFLPTEDAGFLYVRELSTFARVVGPIARVQLAGPGVEGLPGMPFEATEIAKALEDVEPRMRAAGIRVEQPLVVWSRDEGDVSLFGGDRPVSMLRMFMPSEPSSDDSCALVVSEPGLVVCTKVGQVPGQPHRTPGRGSRIREALQSTLPSIDLRKADAIGRVSSDGALVTYAIEKKGNEISVHASHPALAFLAEVLIPSRPRALHFVPPGSALAWGRLSKTLLERAEEQGGYQLAESLDGELMILVLPGRQGVLAMGARSPGTDIPAWLETALNELPRDTSLAATTTKLESGMSTLHVELLDDRAFEEFFEATGLRPLATLFTTPTWLGASGSVEPKTMDRFVLNSKSHDLAVDGVLPAEAAADLRRGRVSALVHVPMDGLSTPEFAQNMSTLANTLMQTAGIELPISPTRLTQLVLGMAAPLSSVTFWVVQTESSSVLRLVIRTFGDLESAEGKQALEAALAFIRGNDPADTLEPLIEKHPNSASHFSYRVRAGQSDDAAAIAMMLVATLKQLN